MTGSSRIDKWLWHARFYRTRSLAQVAARSGRIHRNGMRIEKGGSEAKLGDILTVPLGKEIVVVRILAFGLRRGSVRDAQALYELVDG